MSVHPFVNACLNAVATVLLVLAWRRIKRGDELGHRRLMLGALAVSGAFLASYVLYHATQPSRPYGGVGVLRVVYFTVLISHIVLAATVPFLALRSAYLGIRDRRVEHRRLARFAFPIWMYVSVTGVVVYVMLYHLSPAPQVP